MDKLEKAIAAVEYGIRAAECAGNGKNLGRSSFVMMNTDDLDDILDLLKAPEPRVLEFSENHKPDYNKIGHGLRRIINQMFEFDDRIPRECFSVEDLTALQEAENLMYVLDYEENKSGKQDEKRERR